MMAKNGYRKTSELSRGPPSALSERMANILPIIMIFVLPLLLIVVGKLWSSYGTDIDFESSKSDWSIRIMQLKLLAARYWTYATWKQLEWLLLPILAGVTTTAFSWSILYLDSNTPGQDPPLPFSPKRFHRLSGHTFHLQYTTTLYLGFLVTAKMVYDRWVPVLE